MMEKTDNNTEDPASDGQGGSVLPSDCDNNERIPENQGSNRKKQQPVPAEDSDLEAVDSEEEEEEITIIEISDTEIKDELEDDDDDDEIEDFVDLDPSTLGVIVTEAELPDDLLGEPVNGIHRCKFCPQKFRSKSRLISHIERHISNGSLRKCRFCEFFTAVTQKLQEHECKHTNEKPFQCDVCNFRTRCKGDLTKHQLIHTSYKRYQCKVCDHRTRTSANLKKHMERHDPDLPRNFPCPLCGFAFKRDSALKMHLQRRHNDSKPFSCDQCSFRCKTMWELNSHMAKHTDDHPYSCTVPGCGKAFKTKSDCTKHIKRHSGVKNYACDICGKTFFTATLLRKHSSAHTDVRNFECAECLKKFKTLRCLQTHVRTHQTVKPYQCGVCYKTFATQFNLDMHKRVHQGGRPYQCPICVHGSREMDHLLVHVGSEHLHNFTYLCGLCRKPFGKSCQLQIHIQRCHRDSMEGREEVMAYDPDYLDFDLQPEPSGLFDPPTFAKHLAMETMTTLGADPSKKNTDDDIKDEPVMNGTSDDSGISSASVTSADKESTTPTQQTLQLPPVVQLARFGGIPLCLARRNSGIQLNCQKRGKKPQRWFMDVSLMTESDAERHEEYLTKKAAGLLPQKRRKTKAKKVGKTRLGESRPSTSAFRTGKGKSGRGSKGKGKRHKKSWSEVDDSDEEEAYRLAQHLMVKLERLEAGGVSKAKPGRVSSRPKKQAVHFKNLPLDTFDPPLKTAHTKRPVSQKGSTTSDSGKHSKAHDTTSPKSSMTSFSGSKAADRKQNKQTTQKKPQKKSKKQQGNTAKLKKHPERNRQSDLKCTVSRKKPKTEPVVVGDQWSSAETGLFLVSHYSLHLAASNAQCWLKAVTTGCLVTTPSEDFRKDAASSCLQKGTVCEYVGEKFLNRRVQVQETVPVDKIQGASVSTRDACKDTTLSDEGSDTAILSAVQECVSEMVDVVCTDSSPSALSKPGDALFSHAENTTGDSSVWQATADCSSSNVDTVSGELCENHHTACPQSRVDTSETESNRTETMAVLSSCHRMNHDAVNSAGESQNTEHGMEQAVEYQSLSANEQPQVIMTIRADGTTSDSGQYTGESNSAVVQCYADNSGHMPAYNMSESEQGLHNDSTTTGESVHFTKCLHVLVPDVCSSPCNVDYLSSIGIHKVNLDCRPMLSQHSGKSVKAKSAKQKKEAMSKATKSSTSKSKTPKSKTPQKSKVLLSKKVTTKAPRKKQGKDSGLKGQTSKSVVKPKSVVLTGRKTDGPGLSGVLLATAAASKQGKSPTKSSSKTGANKQKSSLKTVTAKQKKPSIKPSKKTTAKKQGKSSAKISSKKAQLSPANGGKQTKRGRKSDSPKKRTLKKTVDVEDTGNSGHAEVEGISYVSVEGNNSCCSNNFNIKLETDGSAVNQPLCTVEGIGQGATITAARSMNGSSDNIFGTITPLYLSVSSQEVSASAGNDVHSSMEGPGMAVGQPLETINSVSGSGTLSAETDKNNTSAIETVVSHPDISSQAMTYLPVSLTGTDAELQVTPLETQNEGVVHLAYNTVYTTQLYFSDTIPLQLLSADNNTMLFDNSGTAGLSSNVLEASGTGGDFVQYPVYEEAGPGASTHPSSAVVVEPLPTVRDGFLQLYLTDSVVHGSDFTVTQLGLQPSAGEGFCGVENQETMPVMLQTLTPGGMDNVSPKSMEKSDTEKEDSKEIADEMQREITAQNSKECVTSPVENSRAVSPGKDGSADQSAVPTKKRGRPLKKKPQRKSSVENCTLNSAVALSTVRNPEHSSPKKLRTQPRKTKTKSTSVPKQRKKCGTKESKRSSLRATPAGSANKVHTRQRGTIKQAQAVSIKTKAKTTTKQNALAVVASAIIKKSKNSAFKIVKPAGQIRSPSLSRCGRAVSKKRKRFMYVETDTGDQPDPPAKKRGRPPGPKIVLDRSQSNLCFEPEQLLLEGVGVGVAGSEKVPTMLLVKGDVLQSSLAQSGINMVPGVNTVSEQSEAQCTNVLLPQLKMPRGRRRMLSGQAPQDTAFPPSEGRDPGLPQSASQMTLLPTSTLPGSSQMDYSETLDSKPVLGDSMLREFKPVIDEATLMSAPVAVQLAGGEPAGESVTNMHLPSQQFEMSLSLQTNPGQIDNARAALLEVLTSHLAVPEDATPKFPVKSQLSALSPYHKTKPVLDSKVGRKKLKDHFFYSHTNYKQRLSMQGDCDKRRSERPRKSRLTEEEIRLAQDSPGSDYEVGDNSLAFGDGSNRAAGAGEETAGSDIEFVSADYSSVDLSTQQLSLDTLRVDSFTFGDVVEEEEGATEINKGSVGQGTEDVADDTRNVSDVDQEVYKPNLTQNHSLHVVRGEDNLSKQGQTGKEVSEKLLSDTKPAVLAGCSHVNTEAPTSAPTCSCPGDEFGQCNTVKTEEHTTEKLCNCLEHQDQHSLPAKWEVPAVKEEKVKVEPPSPILKPVKTISTVVSPPAPKTFTVLASAEEGVQAVMDKVDQHRALPGCVGKETPVSNVISRQPVLGSPLTNRVNVPIWSGSMSGSSVDGSPSLTIFVRTSDGEGVLLPEDAQNSTEDESPYNS